MIIIRTSVYKRKDGRWEGYALYTDPSSGQERKKSFYGAKKPEVNRKIALFVEKFEAGDFSDIIKVTLEGWLEKYLDVYCTSIEQTTKDGYTLYIKKHINPSIGKIKLRDLKPLNIQVFYNEERKKGYKEKTILQEHRILKRALNKAVVDGLIGKNPCDGVDAPSPEDYDPNIYTEDQFTLLLEKLNGHRMEAIILLAGMCGLRRSELLGLTWEDIDLESETININKTTVATSQGTQNKNRAKNKSSIRQFAIPSVIIPALKRLRGIGKLYTRLDGKDYNPGSVSRIFKEFLKKNDLPHIRLHDLRHFNCTMMLKYGVTEREAMERSGHSTTSMIKKYQHILKDMDKISANKLNSVLKC